MTPQQFKSTVLPLHESMYRMAYILLGNSDDAADAVQDTMLKLWDVRRRLDGRQNVEAYCMNALRNLCLSRITRRHPTAPLEESGSDAVTSGPDERIIDSEHLAIITEALHTLPEKQREVVELSAFGGLSNDEIAEATGISPVNVRSLLSRGRKRLRSLFSKL